VTLESIAAVLLPVDADIPVAVIRTDDRWKFEPPSSGTRPEVIVWGREAEPFGTPLARAGGAAARRELALTRLRARPPRPWRVAAVHRLPPPPVRGGRVRSAARHAVSGGALVELVSGSRPERRIDAVASAAGASRVGEIVPGAGGSVLIRVAIRGSAAILRACPEGAPGDPAHAADALAVLTRREVPSSLARGVTAAVSWSAEAALPGARPRALSSVLIEDVARFCAALPRADGPPTAPGEDLATIAERVPAAAARLATVSARMAAAAPDVQGILRHGDLWRANLLQRSGRLTGVVDWDSWHPSGMPGADLLHLIGMEEAGRTRSPLGAVWLRRPWRSETFRRSTAGYWRELDIDPSPDVLDAAALAWWVAHVATALQRFPALAADDGWIGRNVEPVVAGLGGTK
jgi:hypothetical protein